MPLALVPYMVPTMERATRAQVFHACADAQTAVGERGLSTAVNNLKEQLAHRGVDRVATRSVFSASRMVLPGGFRKPLQRSASCRSSRRSPPQRASSMTPFLNVQAQLARALLRCAPATPWV